jgi:hypothetical protein
MIIDGDTLTFLDSPTPNTDSPAPTPSDATLATQQQSAPSTVPFTAPRIFRFNAPSGTANDVGQPSSGLNVFDTPTSPGSVMAVVATPSPAPVTTTTTQPSGTTGGTTGGLTSGPTSPVTGGASDDLINRLMDLVAAQYAGVAVPGGGTGFGGLVSGPIDDGTANVQAPAAQSGKGLLILALIVAGLGYWFYRSHKHKRAA